MEFLTCNFNGLSAISCNEAKDHRQLLMVSLWSGKFSLPFPFPILYLPVLFSMPVMICQLTPTHFLSFPLCYLSVLLPFPSLLNRRLCCSEVYMKKLWMTSSQNPLNLLISLTLTVLCLARVANTVSVIISPLSNFFPYSMLFCVARSNTFSFQSTKCIPKCSKAKVIMIQLSFCFRKRLGLIWYFGERGAREDKDQ